MPQSSHSLLAPTLLALLLTACDKSTPPEPETAPSEAPAEPDVDASADLAAPQDTPSSAALGCDIDARPAPQSDPPRAVALKFQEAMAQGQRAAVKQDHDASVRAYALAVELHEGDPRAWRELGWAKFKLQDIEGAQQATCRALGLSDTAAGRGATLYNLGRVEELRGQDAQAITYYTTSIALRPSRVVSERLAELKKRQLDPAQAEDTSCALQRFDEALPPKTPLQACQHYTRARDKKPAPGCKTGLDLLHTLDAPQHTLWIASYPVEHDYDVRLLFIIPKARKRPWFATVLSEQMDRHWLTDHEPGPTILGERDDRTYVLVPHNQLNQESPLIEGSTAIREAYVHKERTLSLLELSATEARWRVNVITGVSTSREFSLDEGTKDAAFDPQGKHKNSSNLQDIDISWNLNEQTYTIVQPLVADHHPQAAGTYTFDAPLQRCVRHLGGE